jgi:hypothetical protein
MVKCNLCKMIFTDNEYDLRIRMDVHELWHKNLSHQNRITGVVKWEN